MVNRNIIEDYFTLTGRPIATLTVEEYLLFLKAGTATADKTRVVDNVHPEDIQPDYSPDITPKTTENSFSSQATPTPIRGNKNEESLKSKEKASGKERNALQMLKSIAG